MKKSEVIKLIKELYEENEGFQKELTATAQEVCRCLSKFNTYELASDNPEQARELLGLLERIHEICVNTPVTNSGERDRMNTPDLLRR